MFFNKNKINGKVKEHSKVKDEFISDDYRSSSLNERLADNVNVFKSIFKDDDTIVFRYFENKNNSKVKCCIVFSEGMVNSEIISENIMLPIMSSDAFNIDVNIFETAKNKVIVSDEIDASSSIDMLLTSVLSGDTIFLVDGSDRAMIINSKCCQTRAIEEPEAEKSLRGPREGFTESLIINLSMIKKRLKTVDLKFKMRTIGVRSNTQICICYIEGVANEKILCELNNRLEKISIDGILDSGYIQEMIRDAPFSLFRTIGSTERPDTVAGKLLEGRYAVLVDGSPVALTLPFLFIENFQVNDDYYINFYFSSIGRLLRILSFLISISLPAVYVALVTFHQEMIPTPLIINISAARMGVPFPTIVEAIGLLIVFEILRESGLRMPTFMGQSLSIVGALVIGQAAVDAKFISAPMIIITALTGITSLMIPKINGSIIIIRLIFLFLSSFIGLYGYIFGLAGLLVHLMDIRTFGVPYMYKLMQINTFEEIKDTVIRAPWWYLKYRQELISVNRVKSRTDRSKN